MKFSFIIQQYQTDAVEAVVRVFQGQPFNAGVSYVRDIGALQDIDSQISMSGSSDDEKSLELQDLINDSGFKNESCRMDR